MAFFRSCTILTAAALALLAACTPQQPATPAPAPVVTDSTGAPAGDKFGYVNSLELLTLMPAAQEADRKLQQYAKGKENSFQSLATKYQSQLELLQREGEFMLKSEQEKKVTELQGMEQQLQQLQANAQTDFQQEKDRLYAPIFAEADSIIKLVAKENGYTFVFDAPALLYADTTRNLLPLIKVKMGLPDKPADASKKK